jgi:rhamnosyltransferase subunit B
MKILIQTLGSAGDTHPFIGIGKSLRNRGHEVVVFANEVFAGAVETAGLRFVEMGDEQSYRDLAGRPEVWHERRGLQIIFGAVIEHLEDSIAIIEGELEGADVLVNSTLGFGGRMVRDIHGIPLVTAHLAPALLRSSERLPRTEVMWVRDSYPTWAKNLWWRLGDFLVDRIVAADLNEARQAREMAPIHRVLEEWAIYSPDTTLGLFPDWFGPPQPDWAQPVELTGFPLYDASDQMAPDPNLESWLGSGAAPLVVTAGSANVHAREFFETAVKVVQRLDLRAVLATGNPDDVPDHLPPSIKHETYVPFSEILPRSRALISNGGVGTCAQALAAGIPHLVTHVNFDQRDNASRLEDLSAGLALPVDDFEGETATRAVTRLLDPAMSRRATELSRRISPEDARNRACDQIEQTARRHA